MKKLILNLIKREGAKWLKIYICLCIITKIFNYFSLKVKFNKFLITNETENQPKKISL